MEFERVCRVLYKYEPVEEGELKLEEEAIVYIWDSSNPEWWTASLEMGQTIEEVTTGLIPYNYVEELEHLGKAKALYPYQASNPDELTFEEGDEFFIYQKEGQDWFLVYFNNKYGFIPQSYVEELQEEGVEDGGGYTEYETEPALPTSESVPSSASPIHSIPPLLDSKPTSKPPKDDMLYWRVAEVDLKKKNKKKVRLGISSFVLVVSSEEDKNTPVRQWPISELKKYGIKNKHVLIELRGSKPATFDFSCSSIKQAESVLFKIRSCSQATFDDKVSNKGSGGWFVLFKKSSSTPKAPPIKGSQSSNHTELRPDQRILYEKNATSPLPDLPIETPERSSNHVTRYNSIEESKSPTLLPRTEPVQTSPPTKSPKPTAQKSMEGEIATVLYNFTGAEEDELSVQAEERINVIDRSSDSQWWRCRVYYDNGQFKEGLVPSDYVSLDSNFNNHHQPSKDPSKDPSKEPSQPTSSKELSSGPHPDKLREWTDATGSFKVEAEFLRYEDGKIHLHKANGVRIAVPLEKMCAIDVDFVSEMIGCDLSSDLTEVKRAKAEASRWKDFFVAAGITPSDADTYASTFTREKIDRLLLKEIDRSTLKGLGLTEGDALRVEKAVQSAAITKAPKQKRSVTFANNAVVDSETDEALALRLQREENNRKGVISPELRDYQIQQDELLARKLQEENDPTGSWQNFNKKSDQTNKKYGLGLGLATSKGKGKASGINLDTLAEASAKLEEENKRSQSQSKEAAKLVVGKSTKSSGFDDEIWGVPNSRPSPRQPIRTSSFDGVSKSSTGVDPWQPFSDKPTEKPLEKPVFSSGSLTKKDPKSRSAIEDSWSAVKANFDLQQKTGASTPPQTDASQPTQPAVDKPAVGKNVFASTNTAALPQPLIPIPKPSTSSVFIPTRRPPPPKPVSNVFADAKSAPLVTGGLTTRTGAASPAPNSQSFGNIPTTSNLFSPPDLGFTVNQPSVTSNNFTFESSNSQPNNQTTFNSNLGTGNLFSTTSNYQPSSLGSRTNNQFDELSLEKLGLKPKPSSQRGLSDTPSFQPPRASSALAGGFGVDSLQDSLHQSSSTANPGSSSQSYQTGYLSGIADNRSSSLSQPQPFSSQSNNIKSQFHSNNFTFSSSNTQLIQPLDSNTTSLTGNFSANLKPDSKSSEFISSSLSGFNHQPSTNLLSSQSSSNSYASPNWFPSNLNSNFTSSNSGNSLHQTNFSNLGSSLFENSANISSNIGSANSMPSNQFSSNQSGSSLGNSLNTNSAFSGINPLFTTSAKSSSFTNLPNPSTNQSLGFGQSNPVYGTSSNPTLNTQLGSTLTRLDHPSSYSTPGYSQSSNQSNYGQPSGYGQSSSQPASSGYDQSLNQSGYGSTGYGQSSSQLGSSGYGQSSSQSGYGTAGYGQSSSQLASSGYGQSLSQSGYGTTGYGQSSSQPASSGYGQSLSQSGYGSTGYGLSSNQPGSSGYGQSSSQPGYGTSSYKQPFGQSIPGPSLNPSGYSTGLNQSTSQQDFLGHLNQPPTSQSGYGTTGFNQNSGQPQGYGYNQGR